jgi:hypothetical protein
MKLLPGLREHSASTNLQKFAYTAPLQSRLSKGFGAVTVREFMPLSTSDPGSEV